MKFVQSATFLSMSLALVCASQNLHAQASAQPAPKPQTSAAVKAQAQNPAPGPNAQKKAASAKIGKGKAALTGTGHSASDYVSWAEEVDVDGDGNVEAVDMGLDNKNKVLYMAGDRTFTCNNGGTANGEVLMAVYAKGNTLGRAVGSGWIVAELDAGECSVPEAGLYGCKFDANGNPTECGSAVIQEQVEDIKVTPVSKKG